jgi:hypothetical protein
MSETDRLIEMVKYFAMSGDKNTVLACANALVTEGSQGDTA